MPRIGVERTQEAREAGQERPLLFLGLERGEGAANQDLGSCSWRRGPPLEAGDRPQAEQLQLVSCCPLTAQAR